MNDWRITLMKQVAPMLYIPRRPLAWQGDGNALVLKACFARASSLRELVNSSSCFLFRPVHVTSGQCRSRIEKELKDCRRLTREGSCAVLLQPKCFEGWVENEVSA